jgi:hypothetical protein
MRILLDENLDWRFQLRFPPKDIQYWADRYDYGDDAIEDIAPGVRRRKFLTKKEFLAVCRWKSPRSQPRCQTNSPGFVREVTQIALSAAEERLRIEVLTLLVGVSWPTASVILHFFHSDPYPILDVRALESLGVKGPVQYNFEFWRNYVYCCRQLSRRYKVTMRALDRALWQYSKENQK